MVFGIAEFVLICQTIILFITLVILIWQTFQNTKALRWSQYQDALGKLFEYRSEVLVDEALAGRLKEEIIEGADVSFTIKEYYHVQKFFHVFELLYVLWISRIIDDKIWYGWKNNLQTALVSETKREIWGYDKKRRVGIFHPEYSELIDEIIEDIESNPRVDK